MLNESREMVKKICRLCLKHCTPSTSIRIFSANGKKLRIAEIIRLHFTDDVKFINYFVHIRQQFTFTSIYFQVNENDDVLPAFICTACWTKARDFHDFHESVGEAQRNYTEIPVEVKQSADIETANTTLVDSNRDEYVELMNNVETSMKSEIESDDNDFSNRDFKEESSDQDDVYDPIDCQQSSVCQSKEPPSEPSKIVTTDLATQVYAKTSKAAKAEFVKLIPNYFDMICQFCDSTFTSLNKVSEHYQRKHNNVKVQMKCCPAVIAMADVRDHILHHLNPNLFTCGECGKRFELGRQYRVHVRRHRSTTTFECDVCKKKFRHKRAIAYHMKTMHGHLKGRYECEICKKR